MERYDLTYEEGALWSRYQNSIWTSLEAEYAVLGESDELSDRIRILIPWADVDLWFENGGPEWLSTPEFRSYIERLRAEI